jgi:hypothetical protein
LKIAIIKGIDPICVKMNIMKIPNAYLHMLFFTLSAFCINIFYLFLFNTIVESLQ